MEYYLILARSVTYAQRMQKTLDRAGIRCRIFRAPRDLTEDVYKRQSPTWWCGILTYSGRWER